MPHYQMSSGHLLGKLILKFTESSLRLLVHYENGSSLSSYTKNRYWREFHHSCKKTYENPSMLCRWPTKSAVDNIFILSIFIKVFSLEMFLRESLIKCFSKKYYKRFFNFVKMFSKFCQILDFFSKSAF